jgi:tRNA pseudouridine55 synthase
VGHAGTLDPFATGLLLLAWGRATRLLSFLSGAAKTYRATLELGVTTDTGDYTGAELTRSAVPREALDPARLAATALALTGDIAQRVPAYSAVKVGGEPLHRKARRGEVVDPPVRRVVVHALTVRAIDAARGRVEFDAVCSSGTYVRALATDWGEALGTGATLVALRRLAVGSHLVDGAIPTRDLVDRPEGSIPEWNERLSEAGLTPEDALRDLPRLDLTDAERAKLAYGVAPLRARALAAGMADDAEAIALFGPDGLLAAVAALVAPPGAPPVPTAPDAPMDLRYVAVAAGEGS